MPSVARWLTAAVDPYCAPAGRATSPPRPSGGVSGWSGRVGSSPSRCWSPAPVPRRLWRSRAPPPPHGRWRRGAPGTGAGSNEAFRLSRRRSPTRYRAGAPFAPRWRPPRVPSTARREWRWHACGRTWSWAAPPPRRSRRSSTGSGRRAWTRSRRRCSPAARRRRSRGAAAALRRAAAERDRVAADARSATAQARFTGLLVVAMPTGAALFAELVEPGFVARLLSDTPASVLLALAAALQLVGFAAIRRLSRIGPEGA